MQKGHVVLFVTARYKEKYKKVKYEVQQRIQMVILYNEILCSY